jgi:hypothetical protein
MTAGGATGHAAIVSGRPRVPDLILPVLVAPRIDEGANGTYQSADILLANRPNDHEDHPGERLSELANASGNASASLTADLTSTSRRFQFSAT